MDAESLVDVDDDKVVIPCLRAGELGRVQFGRRLHETKHGGDVRLLLGGRDVTPIQVSEGLPEIAEAAELTTPSGLGASPWCMFWTWLLRRRWQAALWSGGLPRHHR